MMGSAHVDMRKPGIYAPTGVPYFAMSNKMEKIPQSVSVNVSCLHSTKPRKGGLSSGSMVLVKMVQYLSTGNLDSDADRQWLEVVI